MWRFDGDWRALVKAMGGFRALAVYACVLVLAVLVLYWDRTGMISNEVRRWGTGGIGVAILLMAIICLTPVPSEGLLVICMKVYGVWWGVLYGWVGAIVSALVIFPIARKYGQTAVRRFVTEDAFREIDGWIEKKGAFGLLIARLLPLPGFAVSYAAGILPSIGFVSYMWTAAVSLVPYYMAAAFMFIGITAKFVWYIALGAVAFVAFWASGYWFHKRSKEHRDDED